jgi:hypothetical protein
VGATVCAALVVPTVWLLKERPVGERLIAGAVPLPVRLNFCGLLAALSLMLTEVVPLPLAEGVKVALIVQFAPAATELPEVAV